MLRYKGDDLWDWLFNKYDGILPNSKSQSYCVLGEFEHGAFDTLVAIKPALNAQKELDIWNNGH